MELRRKLDRPRRPMGRGAMRTALATVAAGALIALAGCGSSSKPAYCTDRSNLENSIKNLPSAATSSGVSGLKSQINTIVSDANAVVSSAKSDFPTQTSAVKRRSTRSRPPSRRSRPALRQPRSPQLRLMRPASKARSRASRTPASQSAANKSVAMAGRSACRLLAWPSARHPCSGVGAAQPWSRSMGTTSATRTAGKQSDDE